MTTLRYWPSETGLAPPSWEPRIADIAGRLEAHAEYCGKMAMEPTDIAKDCDFLLQAIAELGKFVIGDAVCTIEGVDNRLRVRPNADPAGIRCDLMMNVRRWREIAAKYDIRIPEIAAWVKDPTVPINLFSPEKEG